MKREKPQRNLSCHIAGLKMVKRCFGLEGFYRLLGNNHAFGYREERNQAGLAKGNLSEAAK